MLDFYFIADEQPRNSNQTTPAGGISYEEFIKAQDVKVIEDHLDYYGNFRWFSQNVKQKRDLLAPTVTVEIPNLASILRQAFAAECGLAAFGD